MKYLLYSVSGLVLAVLIFGISKNHFKEKEVVSSTPIVRRLEAVAALGQLSPSGEVRLLAAPISGMGGTPRVQSLLVKEGDEVSEGDVLAIFDNQSKILADLEIFQARLATLEKKIISRIREVQRYKELVSQGGSAQILLDENNDQLQQVEGEKIELVAEIKGLKVDLANTKLTSPITGVVLKINAREGERPGSKGVLEVGSSQTMEALIEVYESDINRVHVGQSVSMISENGGFKGTLEGLVTHISPQVSQRKVLAIDPTGDADARIVEVRIALQPSSSLRVNRFTGMKVIARFEP